MRRSIVAMTGAMLAASVALPVAATPPSDETEGLSGGHKVTICHRTSSSVPENGWVIITVDISSAGDLRTLANHLHHTDDLNNRDRSDFIPPYSYEGFNFAGASHPGSATEGLPEACEGGSQQPSS